MPKEQHVDFALFELCTYSQNHPDCLECKFNLVGLGILLGIDTTDLPKSKDDVDRDWSLWKLLEKWKELCKSKGALRNPGQLMQALEKLELGELSMAWANILRKGKLKSCQLSMCSFALPIYILERKEVGEIVFCSRASEQSRN